MCRHRRSRAAIRQLTLLAAALLVCAVAARAEPAGDAATSAAERPDAGKGTSSLREAQRWTGRHPRLLFGEDDVAALRKRRESRDHKRLWEHLVKRATDDMAVDPDDVASPRHQGPGQMSHLLQRLALVGLVERDRRAARHAAKLLLAEAERGFPAHGRDEGALGDLMTGVALAYDWAWAAMSPVERRRFCRRLDSLATAIDGALGPEGGLFGRLARTEGWANDPAIGRAAGGLGMVALALRGEVSWRQTLAWQRTADGCVASTLRDVLGTDGAGIDGYEPTMAMLRGVLPYVMARRRMDGVDLADGTALGRVPAALAALWAPGPRLLALGESRGTTFRPEAVVLLRAMLRDDKALEWFMARTLAVRGQSLFSTISESLGDGDLMSFVCDVTVPRAGDAPPALPLGRQFASAGLAVIRSGWDREGGEVVAALTCQAHPHPGRRQFDAGQFVLHAYGEVWAGDSGPGRNGADDLLHPAALSPGHSLPTLRGRGALKLYGRWLTFMDHDDWAVAMVDLSGAFDVPHYRRTFIVGKREKRARYVVVIDEVDPLVGAGEDAQVVHYLHTGQGHRVTVAGQTARLRSPSGADAHFAVVSPGKVGLLVESFETRDCGSHPRIAIAHRAERPFTYAAVLVPRAAGDERPVAVTPVFDAEGAVAFRVRVDQVEDRLCVLTEPGAAPPEGFGNHRHHLQLANGAFDKALLVDIEEPGHDAPRLAPTE